MAVNKDDKIVLQGLWRVPLRSLDKATQQINNIHQVNGKDNYIKYLHAESFIPVQETWYKALN